MDTDYLLNELLTAIWEAKDTICPSKYVSVREKSHGNFVTSSDLAMEKSLMEKLGELFPDAGFVSEESEPNIKEYNWVIDPIDGTNNYLFGFPYSISVALTKGINETLIGVVCDCQNDKMFYATNGGGSFSQKRGENALRLKTTLSEMDGITIFGMPYNRRKAHSILEIAEKLFSISTDIKRIGPSSLDICAIAEGKAQIYSEYDLNPWDIQAGKLILEEAGGVVTIKDDLFLFCANKNIKNKVVRLLNE